MSEAAGVFVLEAATGVTLPELARRRGYVAGQFVLEMCNLPKLSRPDAKYVWALRDARFTLGVTLAAAGAAVVLWIPWVASVPEPPRLIWALWVGVICGFFNSTFGVWLETKSIEQFSDNFGPFPLSGRAMGVVKVLSFVTSPLGGVLVVPFDWRLGLTYILGASLTYGALLSPEIAQDQHDPLDGQPHTILGHLFLSLMAAALVIYLFVANPGVHRAVENLWTGHAGVFVGFALGAVARTATALKYRKLLRPESEKVWRVVWSCSMFGCAVLCVLLIVLDRITGHASGILETSAAFFASCLLSTWLTWGWLKSPWDDDVPDARW